MNYINAFSRARSHEKEDVVKQKEQHYVEEVITPDIDQPIEDNFYLVRQRIENLEMQIGKSEEEILELETLKEENKKALEELKSIPEDLGKPSKIDTFTAALEGVRANRSDDAEYDGGEEDTEYLSNINQTYISLFQDSWLNTKSFRFLSKQGSKCLFGKRAWN